MLSAHILVGALLHRALGAYQQRLGIDEVQLVPHHGGLHRAVAHAANHIEAVAGLDGLLNGVFCAHLGIIAAQVFQRIEGQTVGLATVHRHGVLPQLALGIKIVGIPLQIVAVDELGPAVVGPNPITAEALQVGAHGEGARGAVERHHCAAVVFIQFGVDVGQQVGLHGSQAGGSALRLVNSGIGNAVGNLLGGQDVEQVAHGERRLVDKIGERVVHAVEVARHVAGHQDLLGVGIPAGRGVEAHADILVLRELVSIAVEQHGDVAAMVTRLVQGSASSCQTSSSLVGIEVVPAEVGTRLRVVTNTIIILGGEHQVLVRGIGGVEVDIVVHGVYVLADVAVGLVRDLAVLEVPRLFDSIGFSVDDEVVTLGGHVGLAHLHQVLVGLALVVDEGTVGEV